MIMDAQRDFAMLARSFRGLFHAIVVEAFRSERSRPFVFGLAFVLVAAFSVAVRADQQPVGGDDVVLAPDATKWSPQLKGGQWGWHLTKYGHLEWLFRIHGKTLLMLSKNSNSTDNVLWDPLAGAGLRLNHEEYERFTQIHKDEKYSGTPDIYTDRLFALGEGRMIQTEPSPPYSLCIMNFPYYINVYGKDQDLIRSLYVVSKLRDPITATRDICAEGDSGPHPFPHPAVFKYDAMIDTYYAALRDGTILFVTYDGVSTYITRLDNELKQHSSVDGHIFILDADPINAELSASPRVKDSRFRYEVILKKIEELKAGGL